MNYIFSVSEPSFCIPSLSLCHVPKVPVPPVQFPRAGYNVPSWAHFFLSVSFHWMRCKPWRQRRVLSRTVLPLFLFRLPSNKSKHSLSELRRPTMATSRGLREGKGQQAVKQSCAQTRGWARLSGSVGSPSPRELLELRPPRRSRSLPRPDRQRSAPRPCPARPHWAPPGPPPSPEPPRGKPNKPYPLSHSWKTGTLPTEVRRLFLSFAIKMEFLSATF